MTQLPGTGVAIVDGVQRKNTGMIGLYRFSEMFARRDGGCGPDLHPAARRPAGF